MSWSVCKIGDIAHVVTKGTTPTKDQGFSESGVNFIKAEALNGDTSLDTKGIYSISEDVHQKLKRSILQEDDVLLTIAGAQIGKSGIVDISHLPANTNQAVGIMRFDRSKVEPRFIYYWFKQKRSFAYIQGLSAQAAQPNINLSMLKNITVALPGLQEQRAIAKNLSSYDELIENNRRRIQLLEQSAQLLFEEWFVHFRFPGHEHIQLADGVPEGWEDTFLPDLIKINPKTSVEKGKEIRYVPMSSLSKIGMTADISAFESRVNHTSVKFRKNDVLLARITPCLENGKTGLAYFLSDEEVACGSTEFIVMRGVLVSHAFTYCLARSYPLRENAIKSMVGSSGRQRVQVSCFDEYNVPLPPKHLLEMFDEIVSDNFDQIRTLMAQNDKLVQVRALLLPRLMNGEVSV